jgi:hypothetical protein
LSSLPAVASSAICRSHAAARKAVTRSVNCQNSAFGSYVMAVSISWIVLMRQAYRPATSLSTRNP